MFRQYAYDTYEDAAGEPRFVNSCVLFWDVLGIRAMATSADRLKYLGAIRTALARASQRAGTDAPEFSGTI